MIYHTDSEARRLADRCMSAREGATAEASAILYAAALRVHVALAQHIDADVTEQGYLRDIDAAAEEAHGALLHAELTTPGCPTVIA